MRLVLSLSLVLGGLPGRTGDSGTPFSGVERAALAALRGDPQRARAILGSQTGGQADPAALVVLTSIALDEGKLQEAGRRLERLCSLRPSAAECRLLGALLKERRSHPRSSWPDAALAALARVHPLPVSAPLVDLEDRMLAAYLSGTMVFPLPEEAVAKLDAGDAFLVRWVWPRPRDAAPDPGLLDAAIRFARADERFLVHVAALDVLETRGNGPRAVEAAAARHELIERLQRSHGGSLRFIGFTQHVETEAVTEDEVEAIEAAVADEGPGSFRGEYLYLLQLMEKVDAALAPGQAMSAAVTLFMRRFFPGNLSGRLKREPALPPRAQARLARALLRLAEVEEREGLLLADMLARVSLGLAYQLQKDPAVLARVDALRAETDELHDASRCLAPLVRLPIRSLRREWAQQLPVERTRLQTAARMGLICPEPPLSERGDASPLPDASPPDCPAERAPAQVPATP